MRQMAFQTLVEAAHGAAYVTVQSRFEKMFAEGPHGDLLVFVKGDEERVGAPAHAHCFFARRESSYSTCERVLMRISMELSLIFEGVISQTSPNFRP